MAVYNLQVSEGGSDSNLPPSLKLPAKSSDEQKSLQVEKKGLNQKFHVMKQKTYPWHFNHFINVCTILDALFAV